MAYGIKYKHSYIRRSGGLTTINILKKNYSGEETELLGQPDVLEINFTGNVQNIYEPTQGSGAQLKFLVPALSVLDLFTDDPQEFMVKIYHGTNTGTLIWQGFLPCGIYSEDYSSSDIIEIQLIANDGMAVLEDISYKVSESGANYTGFSTVANVLSTILGKINLTFNHIRTSSELVIELTSSNIFLNLKVNNSDYYDENGVAMSCREVLDSIFEGLGLTMYFRGDTVYIVDPISLNDKTHGKIYNMDGTGEAQSDLGGVKDISERDIFYYQTGQNIDIIKPWNQIEIKYDPYTFIEDGYDFSEEGNYLTGPNTWGWQYYSGSTDPQWEGSYALTSGLTLKDWTFADNGTLWGVKEHQYQATKSGEPLYYLQRVVQGYTDGKWTYTFPLSQVVQDDNLMLELSIDTYINTRQYHNIIDPSGVPVPLAACKLDAFQIEIGDKIWDGRTNKWVLKSYIDSNHLLLALLSATKMYIRQLDAKIQPAYRIHGTWFRKAKYYAEEDLSVINDTWTTGFMYLPLGEEYVDATTSLNGPVKVTLYHGCNVTDVVSSNTNFAVVRDIKTILMKNINIKLVTLDKNDITNDGILTTADIIGAETRKKSPLSIKLTNGTGPFGTSKAAFISPLTTPQSDVIIKGLSREGTPILYDTAKLLSQNLISQYQVPRIKMSATFDVTTLGLDIKEYLIKDTDYLSTRKFAVVNGTYSDQEESLKCELIELASQRAAII